MVATDGKRVIIAHFKDTCSVWQRDQLPYIMVPEYGRMAFDKDLVMVVVPDIEALKTNAKQWNDHNEPKIDIDDMTGEYAPETYQAIVNLLEQ